MNSVEARNMSAVIRETLEANRSIRPIEPEIRRLLDRVKVVQARRLYGKVVTYSATLAAAAAILLLVVWPRLDKLAFTVGPLRDPGVESRWIQAEADAPVPLQFSDNSSVELLPGTRARVAALSRNGASVNLETGRLHAKITPRKSANWSISAGPYLVRVVGTEFDVVWEPEALVLEVEVAHGVVKVNGPVLAGDQTVSGSQRLTVAASEGRATIATFGSAAEAPALDANPQDAAALEAGDRPSDNTAPGVPGGGASAPSWQALAKRGEYAKAFAMVERLGFDTVARTVGAEELLQLADVARLGGQPERATQILHTLRRRFPHTRAASVGAYTLGVTAFDRNSSYASAVRWFRTYLQEQPSGPLAAEALGRLMEAEERQGRPEQAEATARRYLELYPKGSHRDVAERLTHN